ncbi:MAG: elongation factor P [Candidatus Pacebacteria bacterium]|jgi:elongation factor P|nr:elongation factor P [Candidatus Paceibacterota bacterium]MBT4651859.1 elongation factor P [Candidatus Paceibacterota bacterium]MBT6755678.1 elongation factor P [Candidatus Paceibacterota bacterium]MBT6921184.1 elongation factor P [Candidatus Paceibacterota bacterium]
MSKLKAGNIKKGIYVLHNGKPHYVTKTQFVSPGKGSAFTRAKLQNLRSGATIEFTFKSHDSVEELDVESRELQFLYNMDDEVVFMDPRSYEQTNVSVSLLDGKEKFLVPELNVYIQLYEDKAIGVKLPPKVKMEVTEAEDAVAGDRQNAGKKPVVMETGLVVQAPLFVKKGESLLIDTETGAYLSRSN